MKFIIRRKIEKIKRGNICLKRDLNFTIQLNKSGKVFEMDAENLITSFERNILFNTEEIKRLEAKLEKDGKRS